MKMRIEKAPIAQLVEQRIENPRVPGSNPGRGTILQKWCSIEILSITSVPKVFKLALINLNIAHSFVCRLSSVGRATDL